ncbi:MAG: response regulator [Azoarcus sp.]|jgi:PleD family two-component response regulator|nr:response regulator [Azoarcus sp.]
MQNIHTSETSFQPQHNPISIADAPLSPLILAIDDSMELAQAFHDMLVAEGYTVMAVKSVEEAMEHLAYVVPDSIVIDATSKTLDGFALGRRIKSMEGFFSVPLLYVIEPSVPEHIIKSYENGGYDYVTKPLDLAKLIVRLKTRTDYRFRD